MYHSFKYDGTIHFTTQYVSVFRMDLGQKKNSAYFHLQRNAIGCVTKTQCVYSTVRVVYLKVP